MMSDFEEIDHTADWAFRVRASTLPELFVRAARAVYALAHVTLAPGPRVERAVTLEAIDAESLLVAWLNELLWLWQSERLACDEFDIETLTPTTLVARVRGAPAAEWGKDIKAATYHDLAIRRTAEGYEVTVVLDV
jgi:SHS2 domain-containing protein